MWPEQTTSAQAALMYLRELYIQSRAPFSSFRDLIRGSCFKSVPSVYKPGIHKCTTFGLILELSTVEYLSINILVQLDGLSP